MHHQHVLVEIQQESWT